MRDDVPELFDHVLALPAERRQHFIDAIADAGLRRELSSLLAASPDAESFFDSLAGALPDAAATALESAIAVDTAADAPEPLPDAAALEPGQSIAQYRIEERLGAGGMGVVYRAFDTRLERMVALKFRSHGLNADTWSRERFLVEARAAAALDHPNVCTIHEVGVTADGASFIAMAVYAGETLEQVLRRGPLERGAALTYTLQIARGLAAAHAQGITHRDVKPGNVLITADDVVKLLDFGIAQRTRDGGSPSGMTPGTIDYMSPEQVRGDAVDHRSDLWSLGVVLYEMCTGERPLRRETQQATMHAIVQERHPPLSRVAGSAADALDAIIDRLLEKDPQSRYTSADEVIVDLEQLAAVPPDTPPPVRRPRSRARSWVAVSAGIGVVVLAVGLLTFDRRADGSRIVVADGVGDTLAGNLVSRRLRQSLAGSRRLELAGPADIAGALQRMGRAADTRLTPDVVHEIALREGIEAYVHVTADRIGNSWALGALLVETETGEHLDVFATSAVDAAALDAAADSLAAAIRDRFGDRLERVAASAPRPAVTTDSIVALSKYIQAVQANRIGEFRRGIELLEEATEIDAGFADAYLTEAFALEQIGMRAGVAQARVLRAWEVRDLLTAHEQLLVQSDYAWHIEGDIGKTVESLRSFHQEVARVAPGRVLNRRSYGLALLLNGQLADADTVLETGRRLAPCPVTQSILVSVLHAMDRDAEARTALREATLQWPTNPLLAADSAHIVAVTGAYRQAHAVAAGAGFGAAKSFAMRAMAVFDAVEGRLSEAEQHLDELRARLLQDSLGAPAFEVTAGIGRIRLLAGDTAAGVEEVHDFLQARPLDRLAPAERPYLSLALFFADARRPQLARALLADYDALVPAQFKGPDRWMLQRVRAALYMAVDSPRLALAELQRARSAARIWNEWFSPLLFELDARPELARVYDRLEQPDSAIAVFERYLAARILHRTELDAFQLAYARRRLAALYERKALHERAEVHRKALARLWREADPGLTTRGL